MQTSEENVAIMCPRRLNISRLYSLNKKLVTTETDREEEEKLMKSLKVGRKEDNITEEMDI